MIRKNSLSCIRFPRKPAVSSDSTRYLDWFHCMVEYPNGGVFEWGFFHVRVRVIVVAAISEDGRIGFVEQYRYALGARCTELVKGFAKRSEPPLAAAKRELAEELGKGANRWDALGKIPSAPGIGKVLHHCFLARDLFDLSCPAPTNEPAERLNATWLTPDELLKRIATHHITDAVSLAVALLIKARAVELNINFE
jgi:ADP-ribose pyrophosphatase